MGSDPLALPPEQMREMGHRRRRHAHRQDRGLRDGPVLKTDTLESMRERLAAQPSSGPRDFGDLLHVLDEDVLPFVGHFDHPRFFGYIPGAGTWPAALGDLIAAATMIDAGSWREAAGPSALELTVLDWFRDWVEYPESAAGVLVSGGSAANLTAIACAREALIGPMSPRIVMYTGDQTHSSVARAARHLGFRPDQLRVLPTDDDFRLRPQDVIAAIDADLAADRLPFLVSANAGTTNTGAVDPIGELADACHERGVWLHVDGAYGAFAVLTDRGKRAMQGMNKADSITLDPHKWLAMPFEVGCLLVREGRLLERAFELHPEYLKEAHEAGVNFADRGLQLTRASRAIKVWLAIETFGLDAFRATIDRAIDQTLAAQARIEADPRLELVTPASLGILTFRRRGAPGEPAAAHGSTQRGHRPVARSERRGPRHIDADQGAVCHPAVRPQPHDRGRGRGLRDRSRCRGGRVRSRPCGSCPDQTAGLGHDGQVGPIEPVRVRRRGPASGSAASRRSPTTRPIASWPSAARSITRRAWW